jgi:hypothetical protein
MISAGWRFDAKPHVCKYAKAKVVEAFISFFLFFSLVASRKWPCHPVEVNGS